MRARGRIPRWTGSRAKDFKAETLALYGDVCHLCGHPGADSVDHLIPRSVRPDLTWDLRNARPAHIHCNVRRKAHLLPAGFREKSWA